MILYKYVSYETAKIISKTPGLRFSPSDSFNDLFETSCHFFKDYKTEEIFGEFNRENALRRYGMLCLSRSPINQLMWAHYCKDDVNGLHSGAVIGIDVEKAGLKSVGNLLIPVQYGSVIYTATKPDYNYKDSYSDSLFSGDASAFSSVDLEALQRVFLHKHSSWGYEEEIRAVKRLEENGPYIYQIPADAIVDVTFSYGLDFGDHADSLFDIFKTNLPNCVPYLCFPDKKTWQLDRVTYEKYISLAQGEN
ncbi:DUF2971 domain-containing protein [Chromobacterium sp. CV08]|uniref:DUF2971 domain-containing protein n=1 Tax=Chromobacterium sp. CV08 TaxID=3133274 RepID=UPI003DA9192A